MKQRVVVTGLGIVAPNGVGLTNFEDALRHGKSGIRAVDALQELNFSCTVGGIPPLSDATISDYFTPLELRNFNNNGIIYGCIAGIDAFKDAGLQISDTPDYLTGVIFGTGTSGIEKLKESIHKIDQGNVKRLGSTAVIQTMASGVSAYLSGKLGLGNQVTTNSSACSTGTEAIIMGYDRITAGKATRMLVGSTCEYSPYLWGGFDAMRVLNYKHNQAPEEASRPMSMTAGGFIPGSGAGAILLESLASAQERGAKIYAEVLGGSVNSGGQRGGGSLTAPNSEAVQKCIKDALLQADVTPNQIDLINGHLTATVKDPVEIQNWSEALGLKGPNFPKIQSTKSMVGHCLSAAGAVESVASLLQIYKQFMHPSINCDDVHTTILKQIDAASIPHKTSDKGPNIIAKASFGFGDVNACVLFEKYN
ncbi:MAG: beta-ketoacyl-[acyl-carrier-protein] synthase family protein [Gilvibacter sp.]